MKRYVVVLPWLVGLGMFFPASAAFCQGPYRPSRPTLSPWINLYNRNPGPLGSYLSNVRPEMELRSEMQQYDSRLRLQNSGLVSLQNRLAESERGESVRPTGTGSVFMNYSHYYPRLGASGVSGRQRARPSPPPSRGTARASTAR